MHSPKQLLNFQPMTLQTHYGKPLAERNRAGRGCPAVFGFSHQNKTKHTLPTFHHWRGKNEWATHPAGARQAPHHDVAVSADHRDAGEPINV